MVILSHLVLGGRRGLPETPLSWRETQVSGKGQRNEKQNLLSLPHHHWDIKSKIGVHSAHEGMLASEKPFCGGCCF